MSGPHRPASDIDDLVPQRRGRSSQYRTYVKTLKNRLQFVEDKEAEWKRQHPGEHAASYYKTELDTLKWVLELIGCFIPEERRPEDAPISVIADECPKCHVARTRPFDGSKRVDPWTCRNCGHQYPLECNQGDELKIIE